MRILLLSTDLMITSQVSAAAGEFEVCLARTADQLLDQLSPDRDLVIVDLDTHTYSVEELVPDARAHHHAPRAIIAFGPHVKEELLASAEAAECDAVMSRGAFHRQMAELFTHWSLQ